MATHGSVSAFDPSKEDLTSYEERLRYYFVANDVTDGTKKRSILLAACRAPVYKLIRSLVQAEKLDSTPYEELVKIVKNHYNPKPSVIMQRYKFNTRTRTTGESITAYVAALKDQAQHCEFKETLFRHATRQACLRSKPQGHREPVARREGLDLRESPRVGSSDGVGGT